MKRHLPGVFHVGKAYREISPKTKFKTKAKAFIEGISKECFGRSFHGVEVVKNSRRQEITFKVRVKGKHASYDMSYLVSELKKKTDTEFRMQFSGDVNPKTGVNSLYLIVVLLGNPERTLEKIEESKLEQAENSNAEVYPSGRSNEFDSESPTFLQIINS